MQCAGQQPWVQSSCHSGSFHGCPHLLHYTYTALGLNKLALCAGARVIVAEIDPICALQATMEGYTVAPLEDVLPHVDIFVTTTGNKDIIMATDMAKMKNNAIVGNIGHFDNEIDMAGLLNTKGELPVCSAAPLALHIVQMQPGARPWQT